MKKHHILIFFLFIQCVGYGQSVFINELHYDNNGADANEGFEIAGPAGTDLSCYTVYFYNGSNGLVYGTLTLSGIIPDQSCGYGTLAFSFAAIQNGDPDGICLYNTCTSTVVQFLSYEGSFTALAGVANGMTSTDIGVFEDGTGLATESLQLTGNGQTYGDFSWAGSGAATFGAANTGQDFCAGCGGLDTEPALEATGISTPTIGCASAEISWTLPGDATNVIVVVSTGAISDVPTDGTAYNASTTFGTGDELVVTDGQFVVYNGTGTSVSVTGLSPGTTYNFAIFGYNGTQANCEENYLTGGSFSSFVTISPCTTPQIMSIMYNSCNGSAEGTDELIIFEMGSDPVPVDSITIELPNSTWCNDTCGSNILVNNQTYIDDLNAMAGCALFVYADPIPAGATVVVFTGNPPSTVLDYSSQCGASGAPYYTLFLDNSSTTGNFVNVSTTPKDLTIHWGSGASDQVTYVADDGVGNVDGATVNFDVPGNPTYIQSVGCIYPLAVRLTSFSGFETNEGNLLKWSASPEENLAFYEIQRSEDGQSFTSIEKVFPPLHGNSSMEYSYLDQRVTSGLVYYRLSMQSFDGSVIHSHVISISSSDISVYYHNQTIWIDFANPYPENNTIRIYDLSGQLVYTDLISQTTTIPWIRKGIFIIEIPEKGLKFKFSSLF